MGWETKGQASNTEPCSLYQHIFQKLVQPWHGFQSQNGLLCCKVRTQTYRDTRTFISRAIMVPTTCTSPELHVIITYQIPKWLLHKSHNKPCSYTWWRLLQMFPIKLESADEVLTSLRQTTVRLYSSQRCNNIHICRTTSSTIVVNQGCTCATLRQYTLGSSSLVQDQQS